MTLEEAREITEGMNSESLAKSYCHNRNRIKELEQEIKDLRVKTIKKRWWTFECWNRHGELKTIEIEALNEENATIIFQHKHPDLGFDPPY